MVSVGELSRWVPGDVEGLIQRDWPLLDALGQGNVEVVERGQHLGFALEPGRAAGLAAKGFRQEPQRHIALQLVSVARYTSPLPPAPMGARLIRTEPLASPERPGSSRQVFA